MIAARSTVTSFERQVADRDHVQRELMSLTVGLERLSGQREQDIRDATLRVLVPIIRAADWLVALGAELDALDGRMDRHVRTHNLMCRRGRPCASFSQLQEDRARLQRRYDHAFQALARRRR